MILQLIAGPDYWAHRAEMKRAAIYREQRAERARNLSKRKG